MSETRGETSKARDRRIRERFLERFAPEHLSGIDIGCGPDPLNQTFRRWGTADGDGTLMQGVLGGSFYTVYASHVLEHIQDPATALRNWYRILRPGGHLIVSVPHRDLYERRRELPSRWNCEHRWFYLPDHQEPPCTRSFRGTILEAIPHADIVYFEVQQDGWFPITDDSQHSSGEYSIEAVIRK